MAAADLLARTPTPSRPQVEDAIGGVLCRCTGYLKIVDAVLDVAGGLPAEGSAEVPAGLRRRRAAARASTAGPRWPAPTVFGADEAPADALWMRVVRSPHARARFTLGDLAAVKARTAGAGGDPDRERRAGRELVRHLSRTPRTSRCWRPAACASAARRCWRWSARGRRSRASRTPTCRSPGRRRRRSSAIDAALAPATPAIHAGVPDNVLTRGNLQCGDVEAGHAGAAATAEGRFETAFVEHAYIEPEAGYAVPVGERPRPHRGHGLHAGALHGPGGDGARAGRRPLARAHPPDRLRRRLRRQARRVGAAAAGGGGVGDEAPGAHRLHAHGVHGLHHQAASGAHLGQVVGRRAGPAHRLRDAGRLQHRRLRLVGADGGQPRAGARHGALQGAERARRARAPSTPTTRRPAPSAASACRRRPSRTRR